MNLSKQKVKYICEVNEDLGIEEYYKQVYLTDLNMWGVKRKITKQTFLKNEKDGYPVAYYKASIDINEVKSMLADIYSLIDLSLETGDKEWFTSLIRRKNLIQQVLGN
ncbi:IDEAL domain-containing protein [Bacillus infantis]|uniref:IDEAL domain-containing protein n=1 Tax=Bacillus infantis TaxID=324767 RepID=UPI00101B9C45|nr:IDEAL domain-containing protein [Bacillus infantis]RYI30510.1 IDEAL domain-containing protein [Bacillus infantis]